MQKKDRTDSAEDVTLQFTLEIIIHRIEGLNLFKASQLQL